MTGPKSLFGAITTEEFLRDYWQRKPLLVRGSFPGFESPLDPDELAGLALEEEVESRLAIEDTATGGWRLQHGPLAEDAFSALPDSHWTLLVQSVDLWVPEVAALLDSFHFLPRWRVDDIMVSYAVDGGSVGPHFDHYDVFLIQGEGRRRWMIGDMCDEHNALLADCPLRILERFDAHEEWLLEPGDMLYLPPQWSHWGVAEGECMTYSVGFRSPTLAEMVDDLAVELMAETRDSLRYRDPPMTPALTGETLDPAFLQQVKSLLGTLLEDDRRLALWFARYMTAPRYPDLDEWLGENPELSRRILLPATIMGRDIVVKNGHIDGHIEGNEPAGA